MMKLPQCLGYNVVSYQYRTGIKSMWEFTEEQKDLSKDIEDKKSSPFIYLSIIENIDI